MQGEITTPVLVSQMELLGDLYYWVRDRVLQEEGLRSHKALSLLRRIVLNGQLSFAELRRMTGATRYTVSRTAKFLVRSGLARYSGFDAKKIPHSLKATARGQNRLASMDVKLKEELLKLIQAHDGSKRQKRFSQFLRLTDRYFPPAGIADTRFYEEAPEPKTEPVAELATDLDDDDLFGESGESEYEE